METFGRQIVDKEVGYIEHGRYIYIYTHMYIEDHLDRELVHIHIEKYNIYSR